MPYIICMLGIYSVQRVVTKRASEIFSSGFLLSVFFTLSTHTLLDIGMVGFLSLSPTLPLVDMPCCILGELESGRHSSFSVPGL